MKPIYAAIDIGANSIKLKIVEYSSGNIVIIEDLAKEIAIGEDVYQKGVIDHQTVKEILKILHYFKSVMDAYEVEQYRAVGTSVLREATNAKMLVEMLKIKTGIEVEIIEDSIEKFLTYKSIRDFMPNYRDLRKSSLVVEINSGSCDVSIYHRNHLIKNEEIKLGTKNLKNILIEMEQRTVNYPEVLSELLETRTSHMWQDIQGKKLKHFICLGGEAKLIKQQLFSGDDHVDREAFKTIYNRLIEDHRTFRYEIESKQINWYEFVISILIYNMFFDLTQAEGIMIPDISLRDGILADFIESDYKLSRYTAFNNDIYSLAWNISKRYRSSEAHVKALESYSLRIFKSLNLHFEFGERDEMLLRLSSILHEIGKYTRLKDYLITSYDKIINLSVLGVTQEELCIIAHVCRLISSSETKPFDFELDGVSEENHGTVFKLSCIMSIADALDKGKRQKISIDSIKITDDRMTIYIRHKEDITLEEISFEYTIQNFINTFGILPELKEI